MSKGLYQIVSGETYEVRANSEEEALAVFFVSQGFANKEDYPDFPITQEDIDSVEYMYVDTIAEPIQDFS
jgi:hypothetical protein